MAFRRRTQIATALRERIERGIANRALLRGDRLPSTREIAAELDADPRVVAAAYRELADEGLVELRPRSGVYVSPQTMVGGDAAPPPSHLAEVLSQGIARGFTTRDFCDYLREAALTRKIRAVVIASTSDQTAGMCRELRDDYALDATGILADAIKRGIPVPAAVSRAHLVVSTEAHAESVKEFAERLGKPYVVVNVKSELLDDRWLALLQREVFFIAVDPRFLALLREYLVGKSGERNVTMLVAGKDDLSRIARDAPTYVTQAARELLGRTRIPGRLIPPARIFASDTARAILDVIVGINVDA